MTDAIDFDRYDRIRPIRWTGDSLELLDQRKLPFVVEYVRCDDGDAVAAAIHALTVRGAPAIGIAAAYGVCVGMQTAIPQVATGSEAPASEPASPKLCFAAGEAELPGSAFPSWSLRTRWGKCRAGIARH
jgi:methylthioribose-1-phosphate isomerase